MRNPCPSNTEMSISEPLSQTFSMSRPIAGREITQDFFCDCQRYGKVYWRARACAQIFRSDTGEILAGHRFYSNEKNRKSSRPQNWHVQMVVIESKQKPDLTAVSLCGAIGQRVRLLTERLVVQAHPGTNAFHQCYTTFFGYYYSYPFSQLYK